MPTDSLKDAIYRTLLNLANTIYFLDDILIVSTGSTVESNKIVEENLKRIHEEGFSLKLSKCTFSKKSIEWLGYFIDSWLFLMSWLQAPSFSEFQEILPLPVPKTLKKLNPKSYQ